MEGYRQRLKGYEDTVGLAKNILAQTSPEEIEKNTKAKFNGTTYDLPWFNITINPDESSVIEKVIQFMYLSRKGPTELSNKQVGFMQVPSGVLKNSSFISDCITPIINFFVKDLESFAQVCESLGGVKARFGHASYTMYPLPHIPVTYVLWQGDDEVADSGTILFDETIIDWFNAEEILCLATISTQIIVEMKTYGRIIR